MKDKRSRCISTWLFLSVLCLSVGGGLVSCGSIQTYSYDELRPAKVSFPAAIRKVAVINNAVPASPLKRGVVTGALDGDAQLTAESLAEALADSKYFDQVMICDSAFRSDTDAEIRVLPPEEVDRLAADLQSDMILSLDKVEITNEKKPLLYQNMPLSVELLQTKVTPTLHVYLPGRDTPLFKIAQTDSLNWDLSPYLSDVKIAEEAAYTAALSLYRILVPYWEPANRLYFDGGGVDMRDGAVYAREGDWMQAKQLWMSAYQGTRSKTKQAKAAFNLALACEMSGTIEEATEWLEKAMQLAEEGSNVAQVCAVYRQQLRLREADLSLLNAQMNRFGDKF